MAITREDMVFLVNPDNTYASQGGTPGPAVRMATSFECVPRAARDWANYSIIANYDPIDGQSPPVGTLGLYVSNAAGRIDAKGAVTFTGRVDWVLKATSVVQVGSNDADGNPITPPYDLSVPFNCYAWVKLGYVATSGDGLLYAKLGAVEV